MVSGTLIELHVKSRGPGKFVMPGLMKISVVKKPATPARRGRNPFTGEDVMFKAKPARRVIKVRALRKLERDGCINLFGNLLNISSHPQCELGVMSSF